MCTLDDISLAFPSINVATLSQAVKKVVRSRSLRQNDNNPHQSLDNLSSTVHVVQTALEDKSSTAKIKRNTNLSQSILQATSINDISGHPATSTKQQPKKLQKIFKGSSDASNHSSDYGFYDFSVHNGSLSGKSYHSRSGQALNQLILESPANSPSSIPPVAVATALDVKLHG